MWNVNSSPSCEQALQLVVFTPWLLSNIKFFCLHRTGYQNKSHLQSTFSSVVNVSCAKMNTKGP